MNDKHQLLDELRIERDPLDTSGTSRRVWLIPVTLVALAAAVSVWLWFRQPPVSVMLVRGEPASLNAGQGATVLDASGYVTARRRATVSSKVTGKVVEVLIEEGMAVTEGQLLARLDSTLNLAQLALTEARLERSRVALAETRAQIVEARRKFDRALELAGRGLASQAAADEASANLETLQARLATGEQDVVVARQSLLLEQQLLADNEIRAPFAGVVIAKAAQPGEMISPISAGGGFTRTGICTIVDMESLEVEVDVNEAYIDRVHDGQQVTARLDAYPDWTIPARVIAIIPTADRQRATVRVRIGFDQRDPRILPDMGIAVSFMDDRETPQQNVNGLALPGSAIDRRDGREVIFVYADGVAQRRAVSLIPLSDERVLVRAGLQPGEQVIDRPPPELTDGMNVKPGNAS